MLLEINTELMYEALVLQNTILEHKKEKDMINEATGEPMERELTGEEKPLHYDYSQVDMRLRNNLAYLMSLASDNKGYYPCPAFLTAPSMNPSIKLRNVPMQKPTDGDPHAEREERYKTLKSLYTRLRPLYPGVDHTKEPIYPIKKETQAQRPGQGQSHGPAQFQGNAHPGQMGMGAVGHGAQMSHGQNMQNQQRTPQRGSNQASPAPAPHSTPPIPNLANPAQQAPPQMA